MRISNIVIKVEQITKQGDIDYLIYTGDAPAHDVWLQVIIIAITDIIMIIIMMILIILLLINKKQHDHDQQIHDNCDHDK